jgi:hypothetical protein
MTENQPKNDKKSLRNVYTVYVYVTPKYTGNVRVRGVRTRTRHTRTPQPWRYGIYPSQSHKIPMPSHTDFWDVVLLIGHLIDKKTLSTINKNLFDKLSISNSCYQILIDNLDLLSNTY